jgi:hypothetical protein
MGFLDKAKAAASDLAAKADTALASSGLGGPGASGGGDGEKYFRDLGVLTYLEAAGRPTSPEDRLRVMAALHELESRGSIRSFALHTAPPPAPGTTGSDEQLGYPPPPTAGGTSPHWQAPPAAPVTPPPPPPSWMTKDGTNDG